jgi:hypothetical protein
MTRNWWTPKNLVFAVTILSLACVAAVVAFGLVYPERFRALRLVRVAVHPAGVCLDHLHPSDARRGCFVRVAKERVVRELACPGRPIGHCS